jgi:hypothetical protein
VIKRQQEKQLAHIANHLRGIALAAGLPDIQAERSATSSSRFKSCRVGRGHGRHLASMAEAAVSVAASSRGAGGRGSSHPVETTFSDTSGDESDCNPIERLGD